jgi:hypothetical protein
VIIQNTVLLIETALISPDNSRDFKRRLHAKNDKAYPADFSLTWVEPVQYEDR